jgi:hypothetical protein
MIQFPHQREWSWKDAGTGTSYKLLLEAGSLGSQLTLFECKPSSDRYINVGFVPFPASLERPLIDELVNIMSLRCQPTHADLVRPPHER